MAVTDHYEGEDVIITFEKEGADTVVNMEAKITNLSLTGGTGEVETVQTFGGKNISIQKPTGEYEVSFDYVTRDSTFSFLNLDSGTAGNMVAGTEYSSGAEASRKRFRIIIWFVGGESAGTNSSGSTVVPKKAGELMRYIYVDAHTVSNDEEMAADEYLKGTVSFKCSPRDESGYSNVFKEWTSAQGTTALTVLAATTHRGTFTWNTTTPAWTGSYRT